MSYHLFVKFLTFQINLGDRRQQNLGDRTAKKILDMYYFKAYFDINDNFKTKL